MKQAVYQVTRGRNPHVAYILSTAASVYLSMLCVFSHHTHSYVDSEEREVALELQEARALRQRLDLSPEIVLVSKIIREALPSHPDSDSLATLIVEESHRANVDSLFITAVIRAESTFRHGAISHRGARGLMQLTPETGLYISRTITDTHFGAALNLHDPATNVRLGIAYLKYLNERFSGNRERALVAYNWGPTNLSNALREKKRLPSQSIQYAHKIISRHKEWRSSLGAAATASDLSAFG